MNINKMYSLKNRNQPNVIVQQEEIIICNLPIEAIEIRKLLINNNQKILKSLQCGICHEVLLDPLECSKCQKSFCKPCIQQWCFSNYFNNTSYCPNKCENCHYRKSHLAVRQLIDELEIKCPYFTNGCNNIMTVQSLEKHIDICSYKIIYCLNKEQGCLFQALRYKMQEHQQNCEYQQWICERCDSKTILLMKVNHDCIKVLKEKLQQQDSKILKLENQFARLEKMVKTNNIQQKLQ